MSVNRITKVTPQGKRKQGEPKATWRRTVEKEIKAMGLTWIEAEMVALDRIGWMQKVEASCESESLFSNVLLMLMSDNRIIFFI